MSESVVDAANTRLQTTIPVAWNMGVRFLELRPGLARAQVPFEGNGNHFGVIYAGVTFTVAETLGGALHLATFDATTHYPLVKSMTIDFLKPGTGALTATTSLTDDEIATIRSAATPDAKVDFELVAEVTDDAGVVVARTRGDYQIRPFGR
ncbi:YiiD C-terminal domain-containing protein [uncultured Jatrophihabitans sp.]|uniref:YiiD C-terminal domain-containing protein n=1 Tax=uncultured Jatrophihabitans sp. TaxID=1610747 RepID=UPI0035CC65A7